MLCRTKPLSREGIYCTEILLGWEGGGASKNCHIPKFVWGLLRAHKLPDDFWRAALMHRVSVKAPRAFLPGLHHQTGDWADGNSVCVMFRGWTLACSLQLWAKIFDLPCLSPFVWASRRCHNSTTGNGVEQHQQFVDIAVCVTPCLKDKKQTQPYTQTLRIRDTDISCQDAGVFCMHWAQPQKSQRGPALWPSHRSTSWREQWRSRGRWWRWRRRKWRWWWWWRRKRRWKQWTREQWQLHVSRFCQDQGGFRVSSDSSGSRPHEGGYWAPHQYEVQVSMSLTGGDEEPELYWLERWLLFRSDHCGLLTSTRGESPPPETRCWASSSQWGSTCLAGPSLFLVLPVSLLRCEVNSRLACHQTYHQWADCAGCLHIH